MFTKILIANRGEIACRVIQTARRLGIATVAVYSEADANARHVRLADEAVAIGPAAARESYLVIDKIIAAAKATGAQAIHPGYGFLSENEDFCAACEAAGIVFIGPPVGAIRAMGSKSAAKALMEAAKVPLTPGYHGDRQEPEFLAEQAQAIGYPVLIKASAGGGGKGMRRVDAPADFAASLASCQREARNAFGDDHVLVEKYVLRPRHVEIQVFADTQGQCVYLFERDCSVQRRHQKVLEEAPAPGMSAETRAAMGRAAVEAAKAVGYVGAGTVEFIVEPSAEGAGSGIGRFFFMEMNTRLQVEHPVTEMITGLDLVEWQLKVAAGEPLPLSQEALAINGHALEARIYAEDPDKGFLPSVGKLIHLAPPPAGHHVRIDTGVEQGDEISPHYDPMIAKLIVWDQDRPRALARMRDALARYRIVGVANNVEFLARLVATPAFANADLDTALIERENALLFPAQQAADGTTAAPAIPPEVWWIAALAELSRANGLGSGAGAGTGASKLADQGSPWAATDGWRVNTQARRSLSFRHGDTVQEVLVSYGGSAAASSAASAKSTPTVALALRGADGKPVHPIAQARATPDANQPGRLLVQLGERRLQVDVVVAGERRVVFHAGRAWPLACIDALHQHGGAGDDSHGGLVAPMPGKVIAWLAEPGTKVAKGAPLLVLEAMKMEHTLAAPSAGVVKGYKFAPGEQVGEGVALVEFEVA